MIRNWLTRGIKGLGLLLATAVTLLLLAGAGFWWWSGTEGSLAWMLRQLARSQPLRVEGAQGSLRSGLRVQRLLWERDGLKVEAVDVHLEWKPLDLITGALQLDTAHAASVRVEDLRPPQPRVVPQSLAVRLRPAIDDLKLGRLEWVAGTTAVTVTDLAGHYRFDGVQHLVQLDSLRWGAGSYRGRANIGALGQLPVDATVDGRFQTSVPGSAATLPLDFSVSLRGPLADLQAAGQLQVGTGSPAAGTRATATARLTPWAPQPVPQAQADFSRLDLRALWTEAPRTSLSGQLQVQPAGTGTWTLTADIANGLAGPWDQGRLPVGKLNGQGEWRAGGHGLVRLLQAQVGGGDLLAKGEWRGGSAWAVQGKLSGVNPAALHSALAPLPVSGSADLQGDGKRVAFDVALKTAGRALPASAPAASEVAATVQALELREGTARGHWSDGLLALPAFDVRTSDARVRGALELRPAGRAGSGRVTLEAPGLQARAEGRLSETSGSGTLQLTAANVAQALRWAQRLPGAPAALRGVAAGGRGEAQGAWQGGWHDPALQARVALPRLEVGRGAAADESPDGAAAWSLRNVTATFNGRLSDAQVQAAARAESGQRRLALEVSGRGGRRGAAWHGQVAALHLTAIDPALGPGTWTLALQRAFDLRWSDGNFEAGAGQASLAAPPQANRAPGPPALLTWQPVHWGGGELRTAGRLTGLPLAWIELLGAPQLAGSALSGDMVFDAQWDASMGATARVEASLTRSRGDLTVLAETAEGTSERVPAGVRDARLTLRSDGEALTLALHWDSERGGSAQGQLATRLARGGAAGWHWPDSAPLSGGIRAQLPRIAVWSLLAPPGWRLRGSLAADVAVTGTRGDPRLSGTLAANDLALRSVVDGIELQGGRLRARLDGQRLLIDDFMLRGAGGPAGGGTLEATGEGTWTSGGPQAQLTAQLTRLRASIRSDRQLTVSGRLAARVAAAGSEMTGQLRVDQAQILLPEESTPRLGDDIVVRGAATRPIRTQARASREEPRGMRRLRLAVDVDLGNDFRVQGQGIDTRLRGTLNVSGQSMTAPRLTGVIHTAGGEYRAYGQRLNIERGVLRFTGPVENPSLDILALRPNLTQRVGVLITGSVLTPYVRLYSEPELPDAEKLSWLVVGRASASGGAEAALLQQAAIALLGSRTGTGKRGMAASLGLDELSFRRDGPDGPAVTLGKRLGRDFYAAYERGLSGALGTLYVFYDLTRRVTVRAEAGTRNAVDLIFTFAFD